MARVTTANGEQVTFKDRQATLVQQFLRQSGQRMFETAAEVVRFLQEHGDKKPWACDVSHLNSASRE